MDDRSLVCCYVTPRPAGASPRPTAVDKLSCVPKERASCAAGTLHFSLADFPRLHSARRAPPGGRGDGKGQVGRHWRRAQLGGGSKPPPYVENKNPVRRHAACRGTGRWCRSSLSKMGGAARARGTGKWCRSSRSTLEAGTARRRKQESALRQLTNCHAFRRNAHHVPQARFIFH